MEEPSKSVFDVLTKGQLIIYNWLVITKLKSHLYVFKVKGKKIVKAALCAMRLIKASDYASDEEDDKEPPVSENPLSPTPAGSLTFAE